MLPNRQAQSSHAQLQQHIFQNTLNPQEQHDFRQLQARMNAFAVMGNTGVAPNRNQLSQQQQQQAIQHAKVLQQQLLQRFPAYFHTLRQYQLVQQQKRRQQAQAQAQVQGAMPQQLQQLQQQQQQQLQQQLQQRQQLQSLLSPLPKMNHDNQKLSSTPTGTTQLSPFVMQGPDMNGGMGMGGMNSQQQLFNQQMFQRMQNLNQSKEDEMGNL